MRLIDADKLMEWYANTPDCNIDDCHVSIPVIRQNIIDMPTVNSTVYVAYAHHFDGHVVILGVYYSPDDARRVCKEWEDEYGMCDWTEFESFEIK